MKIIASIFEKDLGISSASQPIDFPLRQTARAVVIDEKGRIALAHASTKGFYKLLGGTLEPNETPEQALHRELLEEAGMRVKIIKELGIVREYREQKNELLESFGFLVTPLGNTLPLTLTEEEKSDGYEVTWSKNIHEAITLVSASPADSYVGRFNIKRELTFLEHILLK